MPLTIFPICLVIFAMGIALFLVAKLLRSYPIIFFALLFIIVSSILAIMDGREILAILWLVFSTDVLIAGALHFYKNKRGAFWWSFGGILAMIVAAFPLPDQYFLLFLAPVGVFLFVGFFGSLIMPRLIHKKKNERNHITNVETVIGQRIKITKSPSVGKPARGILGDVDWAVEPVFSYESFKAGDVVVVHKIQGVTLFCTRDGKDFRKEQRQKSKDRQAQARIEAEKKRAEREAAKAQRKIEAEKEKARKDEEKAKRMAELRKIKDERAAQKKKEEEELRKVRADRLEAARARKLELAKAKLEVKKQKLAQKAAKKTKEPKEVKEEPIKEEPIKEEPVKEEKVIEKFEEPKEVKEEPVKEEPVKEEKCCKCRKSSSSIYLLLSAIIIALCIIAIVLCCISAFASFKAYVIFAFFVFALAYLITIFILEVMRSRNAEGEQIEEKAEEPATVIEEKATEKVEEPTIPEAPKKEKAEFVPFSVRMREADQFLRDAYNELKAEVLSYGIKSRVSSTSDRFRLHKKEYVKMVIAGQFLKLYFALNPEDYKDTTYPFDDAGRMGAHKDTPFVFKIRSGLSVRRAKQLINDVASKNGLTQGEVVPHDYATDLENAIVEEEDAE